MMYLDPVMEEYLSTLDHVIEDRHYDSEDYSERELASAELEAFVHWVEHTKGMRIKYEKRD